MKSKIWTFIFLIGLVAGIALGTFTDILNDLPAICVSAFGLGGLILKTWTKSEKKNWATVASLILMVVTGIAGAFSLLTEEEFNKILSTVISLGSLILSILTPILLKFIKKTE